MAEPHPHAQESRKLRAEALKKHDEADRLNRLGGALWRDEQFEKACEVFDRRDKVRVEERELNALADEEHRRFREEFVRRRATAAT